MLKQIELLDIEGKTVRGVAQVGRNVAIAFTDGTFIHLGIEGYSEDPLEIVNDSLPSFEHSSIYDDVLVRAGVFTQEELDAYVAKAATIRLESERRYKIERERSERMEYQRLHAKLGDRDAGQPQSGDT